METPTESNNKVLVTGGTSGIGRAIVKALAAAGYDIAFTYNQSVLEAEQLEVKLSGQYLDQVFESYQADFTDRNQIDELAAKLSKQTTFYGFVHNAGRSYDPLAALIDQKQSEDLMQINFWAMTTFVKAVIRPMLSARTGRTIAIGTGTSSRGVAGNSVYSASKSAMMNYIRNLAIEVVKRSFCANYIASGFVDTGLLDQYREYQEDVKKTNSSVSICTTRGNCRSRRFFLWPSASYMTGSVIQIDGGLDANLSVQY